ncbi:exopolysaccharide biosynthesis polyprenyl glycosylphosphotransferase [Sphingomonas sp. Y38-1Y]|uniref:exopolysaccharide biosynthesis polyprenyl glycosylphosphotransferase n=1 Tax=Sphingomonas sp. Y38-1Y TaxID=3078265 RepID=UPI0028E690B7|nr:exopolysaccharide biosynthesis polyprenyl glycosylphosphotransferase [Sphingomonas sp. Y38-1Y]
MNVEAHSLRATQRAGRADTASILSNRAAWRARVYASLVAIDLICIFFSFLATSQLYPRITDSGQWLLFATVVMVIYGAFALTARAYSSEVIVRPSVGMVRAIQALLLSIGTVVLFAFYLKTSEDISRVVFAGGSVLSLLSISVLRHVFLRRAHLSVAGNPYCVAIIVDGDYMFDPRGFSTVIHAGSEIDPEQQDCPTMFDRLAMLLKSADRVIVACPPDRRGRWVEMLKGANIRSELIAPELSGVAPLALDHHQGTPTLVVADGPLSKSDALVKRMLDIGLSLPALIGLLPLLAIVALLVKATSKGPVLFVQTRIGQGNRLFQMYKFRSMRVEGSDGAGVRSASRGDDRITPIGRFIRSTSIDELPQLFNVLLGDMSIVGPRPHALGSRAENKLFWEVDRRYWHRHAAKPGLTGLAQIRGFRGATERTSDLTNRLHADLEYLHDWSIWRDIVIIIQTVRVLVHRNAF